MLSLLRSFLSVTVICATLAAPAPKPKEAKKTPESANPAVRKWMHSMTLREKVAQLIVMPIYGEATHVRSANFRKYQHYVRDLHVGGVIVTGHSVYGSVRNAEPYAMAALLNRMQKMAKVPLLVAADFERGASMRVNGTAPWPYNMAFAAAKDLDAAHYQGAETAREARAMGVNWLFAPVADVNNNPDNPIINIRSYGENPAEVSSFVQAYIQGAHSDNKNPVLVTTKHFPGHGDTAQDSHIGLARLEADRKRIETVELEPFRASIAAGVDAIMTAHMAVPALEPENEPATVSSKILTGVLRQQLSFQGIIVTDAMDMQGLASMFDTAESAVRALQAGSDVLLMPRKAEDAINGVLAAVESGRLTRQRIDESVAKVLAAKARLGLNKKKEVKLEGIGEEVDSPEAEERAQEVADRAVTLVKDKKDQLPLRHPENTCVIALAEGRRSQQGMRLVDELKKRAPKITAFLLDPGMSKTDLEEAGKNAGGCGQIVVAAYVSVAAYRGNVALAGLYPEFLNGLIAGKIPVTLAALGNPYLIRSFPEAAAYLTTYSPTPDSETALAKALFGEIAIGGKLPVTIPGIAKYGDGIKLAVTHTPPKGL
ncbi:MAG TPA: glycoside hydrolase family 3 N-terminal domain-containing protein [Bryobacteraceae bacterium]|nr:glycoside hydrolase family 3 N-terminal domain-containing protein [Bryobacteraceae bacterium]